MGQVDMWVVRVALLAMGLLVALGLERSAQHVVSHAVGVPAVVPCRMWAAAKASMCRRRRTSTWGAEETSMWCDRGETSRASFVFLVSCCSSLAVLAAVWLVLVSAFRLRS